VGSVITPCYEQLSTTQLYSSVHAQTFYDGEGRAVETRTPGPGANDTIVFTVYNAQNNTTFKSVPFTIARGSGWVDPKNAIDPGTGKSPAGTTTYSDALGRVIAVQDPTLGSNGDGIACSATLAGTYTACFNYSLGTDSGDSNIHDSNTYVTTTSIDPNKHVTVSYVDALGRTVYSQEESGRYGGTLTPNQQTNIQYNVLFKQTQVQVDDLAAQTNQAVTRITTTMLYDSLGRLTQLVDPDRGMHTYAYDADGRVITNVSGSRTLGSNYDLLGRLGCLQDAAPTINATGACSNGNPLRQNTYDTTANSAWSGSDYPIGELTRSVSTTYNLDTSSTKATVTQNYEHDQRGRLITQQMQIGLPSSWNVTTSLPTYQRACEKARGAN
jgi:YD repeat-containing protein